MITKGIIKSLDMNGNTCTVRMPFFETAGNDEIVGYATISNTPGSYNGYKVDDVVWVAFEDGQMDTPVIIGKLYLGVAKEKADPRGTINVVDSITTNSATIPADTKLGASVDLNVTNTKTPYSSLASVADKLNSLNNSYNTFSRTVGNQFESVVSEVKELGTFTSVIKQEADQIALTVTANYDDLNGKYNGLDARVVSAETNISQLPDSIMATARKDFLIKDSSKQELASETFGWDLTYKDWTVFKTSTLGANERPNPDNVHIGIATVRNSDYGTYFFTNHQNQWPNGVWYYLFNSRTGAEKAPWPGDLATWDHKNDLGEDVWRVNINIVAYDCIIFSGGWWQTKTVDLLIANMPEAKNAWFPTETEINVDGDVVWKCGYWHHPLQDGGDSKGWEDYITLNGLVTTRPARDVPTSGNVQNIAVAAYDDGYWHWNDDNSSWHGKTCVARDGGSIKADGTRIILKADENGLTVCGTIQADDGLLGSFNIGKRHQCTALGSTEANPIYASGIFSTGYIDTQKLQIHTFEQQPKEGAIGVYVGTDGIRLGDSFWVDHEGEIFASKGTISGDIKVGEFTLFSLPSIYDRHIYYWPCTSDCETRNNGAPWTESMFTNDEWASATERELYKVEQKIKYDEDGNPLEFKPFRFSSDDQGVNIYGGVTVYSLRVQGATVPADIINKYDTSTGKDPAHKNSTIIKPECYERPIGTVLALNIGNNGEYKLGDNIYGVAGWRDYWDSATVSNSVLNIDGEAKVVGEDDVAIGTTVNIHGANLRRCWVDNTAEIGFGEGYSQATIKGQELTNVWEDGSPSWCYIEVTNVKADMNYLGYCTAFYAKVDVKIEAHGGQTGYWQSIYNVLEAGRDVRFKEGDYNKLVFTGNCYYQLYIRGCPATSGDNRSFSITLNIDDFKDLAEGRTVYKSWSLKIAERSGWAQDYVGSYSMFKPTVSFNTYAQEANNEIDTPKFNIKESQSKRHGYFKFEYQYQDTKTVPGISYSATQHTFSGDILPDYNGDSGDKIGRSDNPWANIYCKNLNGSSAPSSDKKLKYDINYDISKYDSIFDNLKPTTFRYKNGEVARVHLGFIAQDLEQSVFDAGMTRQDMAAIVIDGKGFDKYEDEIIDESAAEYRIRYHELHALEVRQIQMLKQRVAELEELVNKLVDEKSTKKKTKKED